jgi:hypothetical protein
MRASWFVAVVAAAVLAAPALAQSDQLTVGVDQVANSDPPSARCLVRTLPTASMFTVLSIDCTLNNAPASDSQFEIRAFEPTGQLVCQGALSKGSGACSGTLPLVGVPQQTPALFARTLPSDTALQVSPADLTDGLNLHCRVQSVQGVGPTSAALVACDLTGADRADTSFEVDVLGVGGPVVCQGALLDGSGNCAGSLVASSPVGDMVSLVARTNPSSGTAVDSSLSQQPPLT